MTIGNYVNQVPKNGEQKDIVFKKIIDEIHDKKELKELYLRSNRLTGNQIEQLAKALSKHEHLTLLDLSYNEIDVTAIPFIKQIILQLPTLKILRLGYNNLGEAGLEALLEGNSDELAKIKSVDIHVDCNRITENALKKAMDILSPTSILSILTGNYILDQQLIAQCTAKALAELNANQNALIFSSQSQKKEETSAHAAVSNGSTPSLKASKSKSTDSE